MLLINLINRRLGENRSKCTLKRLVADVFHIITNQNTNRIHSLNVEIFLNLVQKLTGLYSILCFLFGVDSSNHTLFHSFPTPSASLPVTRQFHWFLHIV